MKVVFYLSRFPELSQTFVFRQISALLNRGVNVEILANSPGELEARRHETVQNYKLLDVTFYTGSLDGGLPALSQLGAALANWGRSPPRYLFRSLKECPRLWKRRDRALLRVAAGFDRPRRYDAIIAHFGQNGVAAMRLRRMGLLNGPLFTVFHGFDLSLNIQRYGALYYKELFAEGDWFLPISLYWKRRLLELGCPPDRVRVLHVGVDVAKYAFRARNAPADGPVRILTVARLTEKKGVEYAIRAVAQLAKKSRIRYIIIGDGPLRANLEKLSRSLKADSFVEFRGALPEQEIIHVLSEVELFIQPSVTASNGDQEGIPVALMEAMASGIPVVSTWHSGIPELVDDGVSGLLVPERDPDALHDALRTLLCAPGEWERMGTAGRCKITSTFLEQTVTSELTELIKTYSRPRPSYLCNVTAPGIVESD